MTMKNLKEYNYYKIDHAASFVPDKVIYKKADLETFLKGPSKSYFFGAKGRLSKYKPGRRVKIYDTRSGQNRSGLITKTHGGAPVQIKLDSGALIPIFGLIIELIPIIERLILAIKDLFKK